MFTAESHNKNRMRVGIAMISALFMVLCAGGASAQEGAATDSTTVAEVTADTTKKQEPVVAQKGRKARDKKLNIRKFKKEQREKANRDTLPDLRRFEVVGGMLREVAKPVLVDSLKREVVVPDSILNDSIPMDSLQKILSKKEQRRLERQLLDSTTMRHSRIFRDSIPLSRMSAISFVVPGFSQLYNRQAWKIPILYGVTGGMLYGALAMNKEYRGYKKSYDAMVRVGAPQAQKTPTQYQMIKYNTFRQAFFAGTLLTYIYFIGDGVLNYDGAVNTVKKATTLSTIFPGAGQFYNKSYWKLPIVAGGFATMAYIIDFNSRGYQRFKLAYDLRTDGDDATKDEFDGRRSDDDLRYLRNSYRRNRDLSIILTGALYLLNIVDAHVDAHLKDYDISDDLAFNLEPAVTNFYSQSGGYRNLYGMSLSIRF